MFDDWRDILDFAKFFAPLTAGVVICLALVVWPFIYMDYKAGIERYYAFEQTVNGARNQNISDYERVTLTKEIAEMNKWVKGSQYYNHTIFDWYIPDEIDKLELIK